MSARHRQHKKKLVTTKQRLAECETDLVSYERVIADMEKRRLAPFSGAQAIVVVTSCRDAIARDCVELRKVVADLEKTLPP